jgi:hypothetical protein
MALVSSKVAAGMTILADHFNKLWADLTANHDHSSGQGGTIDHADLNDTGDMSGFNHNHTDLETHLSGGGVGDEIDNPGGSRGVHGLAASAYVAGNLGSGQLVFFVGKTAGMPADGSTVYFSADGSSPASIEFDSAPFVLVALEGNSGGDNKHKDILDFNTITTTSFDIYVDHDGGSDGTRVHFLAIGEKS